MPTKQEWRAIQAAAGPGGVSAEDVAALIIRDRAAYARLQDCVQRHKLGLGGERVDALVVAALDRKAVCDAK